MPRKSVRVPWVRQTCDKPLRLVGNSGEWAASLTKNISTVLEPEFVGDRYGMALEVTWLNRLFLK